MSRANQWFVPDDGIAREVITADIQRYLGPDALVRPGDNEGKPGYWITAYRTVTAQIIQDLKLDTQRWKAERENGTGRYVAYQDSRTHAARQHWGPSESFAIAQQAQPTPHSQLTPHPPPAIHSPHSYQNHFVAGNQYNIYNTLSSTYAYSAAQNASYAPPTRQPVHDSAPPAYPAGQSPYYSPPPQHQQQVDPSPPAYPVGQSSYRTQPPQTAYPSLGSIGSAFQNKSSDSGGQQFPLPEGRNYPSYQGDDIGTNTKVPSAAEILAGQGGGSRGPRGQEGGLFLMEEPQG